MNKDLFVTLKDILNLPDKATEESVIRKVKALQKKETSKKINAALRTPDYNNYVKAATR